MRLKSEAKEILKTRAAVRHARLPYVFWEWKTPVIATCLLGLQRDTERAFGKTWPQLQHSFDSMLWVSGRADAANFLSLAAEIQAGQL
jgi:hypothetical protein